MWQWLHVRIQALTFLSRDIICRKVSGELESLKYRNIFDININMVSLDTCHVKKTFREYLFINLSMKFYVSPCVGLEFFKAVIYSYIYIHFCFTCAIV